MYPEINVSLSIDSRVGVKAGIYGIEGAGDIFDRWSEQNATLIITNTTDYTWTYTVTLTSLAFMSLPFFFEKTLSPGQSASETKTLTMIGEEGVHDIFVTAIEDTTGIKLFDQHLIDTISIVEPVPELNVEIQWDIMGGFDQFTTQWATLTIQNPTDQEWTYNVFLLSSAFILGLPPFWEKTLAPGQIATTRVGPLMTGAAGPHNVFVTVETVPGTTIIDNRLIDTITIVELIPVLGVVSLVWDNAQPFTRYSTQWLTLNLHNPTDQEWTYDVRIECAAFALPGGWTQDITLGPGASGSLRDGPFINGADGTYDVTVVASVNGVEVYNGVVGTVTVFTPIPAMGFEFGFEESPVLTLGLTGLPCEQYGDLNDDGVVDMADWQLVANYLGWLITLTPDQLLKADVNGDGVVDDADLQLILDFINGTITNFPVCP